jgi:nitrate reductase gamma subunit
MKIVLPLIAVIVLALLAYVGVAVANLQFLFGIIIPYAAIATFILGFIYRVVKWGRSPVPFSIPTTAGQQKTLPWIKQNKIDNPSTTLGVVVRMAFEVLTFRSLFRNTKTELRDGPKLAYGSEKWLWLGALAFHWSFLVIFLRHFRFFIQDVPGVIKMIESLDSFFQIGAPLLYMTDVVFLVAVTFLIFRRLAMPLIKYISLPSDVVGVKELVIGLISFSPVVPEGIGALFYSHLFLVSVLLAYFPMSKLMHMGGVFLSPTRNMPNDSRMVRHINPWNYPVHLHTYEEYENDFREKMKKAGIPVEKE